MKKILRLSAIAAALVLFMSVSISGEKIRKESCREADVRLSDTKTDGTEAGEHEFVEAGEESIEAIDTEAQPMEGAADDPAAPSIRDEQLEAYFGYVPTEDELDLFYRTVQAECGYQEPDEGVGAVADVIANRCRSDLFPDTLEEVITQKNQFTTWGNGMIAAAVPSEQVLDVCSKRFEDGVAYDYILFFTAGYYNPYCKPEFVIGHSYFGSSKL